MKKILKSALLLMMGLVMLASCEDDRDDNPTITTPTEFVLNTPAIAGNTIDLANSSAIVLTCSQPNYGFPAETKYSVQVSVNPDMEGFEEIQSSNSATIDLDASLLASTLTQMELNAGKTEEDFPMNIPVYIRLRACMTTETGAAIDGTEILSNVVALSSVHLRFSLPPVTVPDNLYVVGKFCEWDWGKCLEFVHVYDHPETYWRLVWIDESGVKINTAKAWDGGQKGYSDITVDGDLKGNLSTNDDGNICSATPQWYLMIVNATVEGRDIKYNVQFNEPNVYLIGKCMADDKWTECSEACKFTVPETAEGDFVSPAFLADIPEGDDSGVRAYVKIPGNDWWHSEFMAFKGNIEYRGAGGDQDRVSCKKGQKLYLNFANGTGEIK